MIGWTLRCLALMATCAPSLGEARATRADPSNQAHPQKHQRPELGQRRKSVAGEATSATLQEQTFQIQHYANAGETTYASTDKVWHKTLSVGGLTPFVTKAYQ
jgi:hypothetical protein